MSASLMMTDYRALLLAFSVTEVCITRAAICSLLVVFHVADQMHQVAVPGHECPPVRTEHIKYLQNLKKNAIIRTVQLCIKPPPAARWE